MYDFKTPLAAYNSENPKLSNCRFQKIQVIDKQDSQFQAQKILIINITYM